MREAASFIASQTATRSTGILATVLETAARAYRVWNTRRQLRKLTELDDHLLADIGVRREDVHWALQLPFSHEPVAALQRCVRINSGRGWRG